MFECAIPDVHDLPPLATHGSESNCVQKELPASVSIPHHHKAAVSLESFREIRKLGASTQIMP